MHTLPATGLRQQAEMLASLSLKHLSSATRNKLADDDLSVNAYPTDCGGFVYVGAPSTACPRNPIWPCCSRWPNPPAWPG